jgi:hypothetical protein
MKLYSLQRLIQLSPQSVAMLNVEQLGIFESCEQLSRLGYIFALTEPMGDTSPLLDEMCNALLDLGLRTEFSMQLSPVFHLTLPFVLGPKPSCICRSATVAARMRASDVLLGSEH